MGALPVSIGHANGCIVFTRATKLFCVFHIDSIFTVQAKPLQKWRYLHTAQNQIQIHLQVPWTFQREVLRDRYVTTPSTEHTRGTGLLGESLGGRSWLLQPPLAKALQTVPIMMFSKQGPLVYNEWAHISQRLHVSHGVGASGFP